MKEYTIRGSEIRALYSLADRAGLLDKSLKEDEFHLLINRETKKISVKDLTRGEFFKIYSIIRKTLEEDKKYEKPTKAIINKAWKLMYELEEISPKKSYNASVGERMCGVIRKVIKVDAHISDPFRFVNDIEDVAKVIEEIKRYIKSEKIKIKKNAEGKALGEERLKREKIKWLKVLENQNKYRFIV